MLALGDQGEERDVLFPGTRGELRPDYQVTIVYALADPGGEQYTFPKCWEGLRPDYWIAIVCACLGTKEGSGKHLSQVQGRAEAGLSAATLGLHSLTGIGRKEGWGVVQTSATVSSTPPMSGCQSRDPATCQTKEV